VALGESPLDIARTLPHADAMVALANALLAAGEREEARNLVDSARAVHDRYPIVAEHFRAPLARAASRLAEPDTRSLRAGVSRPSAAKR
jgi:hypothetical protein